MGKKRSLLLLVAVGFWSGLLLSAPAQDQRPRSRERIRENIHRLRLLRMTEALGLTEEQTAKIYPFATRKEKEKRVLLGEINDEMQHLRELLAEAVLDEGALLNSVEKIREMRQKFQDKDREFEAFLEENLSPLQMAKYLLFEADFYRGVTEVLRRQGRQGRAGPAF
jgi:Spy/CpxP family protein refolding chaperone